MEKQSYSTSKMCLRPRTCRTFAAPLENQLIEDRKIEDRKKPKKKDPGNVRSTKDKAKSGAFDPQSGNDTNKSVIKRNIESIRRNTKRGKQTDQNGLSKSSNQQNWPDEAHRRWENNANEDANLVVEAAEELEWDAPKTDTFAPHTPPSDSNAVNIPVHAELETDAALKLKLQLFPVDDMTCKSLEEAGYNPYLELTLKSSKRIPSVVRHLTQKWAKAECAKGQVVLYPYGENTQNLKACPKWTYTDDIVTARDVYAALGNPPVFRMRYGWAMEVSQTKPMEAATKSVLEGLVEDQACEVKDDARANSPTLMSFTLMECSSRPDAKNAANTVDASDTSVIGYSKGHEIGAGTENCLWLFEGSKDGFSLQLWNSEGHELHNTTRQQRDVEWGDSLTNISVGELLNEVSQAAKVSDAGDARGPAPEVSQLVRSWDSFDAAVAAHHQRVASTTLSTSTFACWDGEDTRDAFTFQELVSGRDQNAFNSSGIAGCEETTPRKPDITFLSLMPDCGGF